MPNRQVVEMSNDNVNIVIVILIFELGNE